MSIQAEYLGMRLELNPLEGHHAEYFRYCAAGDFRLQKCRACGLLRYPPGSACPWCAQGEFEWAPVGGRGAVHSYFEVHHAIQPAFKPFVPYLVLLVELDAQKGVPTTHEALRVVGNLVAADGQLAPPELVAQVGIGSRVRMRFAAAAPELALPHWQIDEHAPQPRPWRYPG
ncbi:MAG: Zn-ribbon domain-containing OB-fold protein [Betaproteobacteria bacterium]